MKQRYPRQLAIEVANELRPYLEPVTCRLACAGSLRRGKPEVGDLELLYIPKVETVRDGLFDTRKVDLTEAVLAKLLNKGILAKRPNKNGHYAWGVHNKLALHVASGLPVDLFSTTAEKWFVSLVVRTGPAELNVLLCESAIKKGLKLHAYGEGFTDRNGNSIPVVSEEDLFEKCGLEYKLPKDRRV